MRRLPTATSPSNLVAVGRKLDHIHNYEAPHNHGGSPRTGRMRRIDPKLPLHASSEDNACRRRVAFGQHSLEKLMTLQFPPLRGHNILIGKIRPSRAWLCSMAQVEPSEATGS